MFAEMLFVAKDIPQLFERNDDDMYDRLSHRWTAALLVFLSLISTATTYVGDPMHCWVPAHFTGGWGKYADNYCWIKNTYHLPFENEIPKDIDERERRQIVYYQWVPIIFMFQAMLFYFPVVIWRGMNNRTGVDMNDVIETAEKVRDAQDLEAKEKRLYLLTKQTHRYLGRAKQPAVHRWTAKWLLTHCFCVCCGKHFGNYMTALYIVIKFAFLANVILQFFLLNSLMGHDFAGYGFYVIDSMANGVDWTMSNKFPRTTLCDLNIRRLGNNHRYTVQCVLSINLFTEKMFLLLWFWMVWVLFATVVGIILLMIRSLFRNDRLRYIQKHLQLGNSLDPDKQTEMDLCDRFVYEYLKQDGALLMRLVGHNTNSITVTELICSLWDHYKSLPHIMKGIEAAGSDEHLMDKPPLMDSKPNEVRETET